ncbi:hypothetical protein AQJ54_06505 [Streptomyces griseorubiginosus]|uniref:Uncharacterized protein n=1 Tax=Streptomyces griseorubiginosus TaxID=67304 RepID=A0A117R4K9_9ACTN|nr:hypothetical protein AQJ54_06505 [Streptomyces griseorubiginosus]
MKPSPRLFIALESLLGFSIAMTSGLMRLSVWPAFAIAVEVWLAYLAVSPMLLLTCFALAANLSAAAPFQCSWIRATSFSNSDWMLVSWVDSPIQPLATPDTSSGLACCTMAFISSMSLPLAKGVVCFSLKHMFISV